MNMIKNIVRSLFISESVFLLYALHINSIAPIKKQIWIYIIYCLIVAPLNVLYTYLLSRTRIGPQMFSYSFLFYEVFLYLLGSFAANAVAYFIGGSLDSYDVYFSYLFFIVCIPMIVVFILFAIFIHFEYKKGLRQDGKHP